MVDCDPEVIMIMSYRVLYRPEGSTVWMVAVVHGRWL
jgi:hypothetical protein